MKLLHRKIFPICSNRLLQIDVSTLNSKLVDKIFNCLSVVNNSQTLISADLQSISSSSSIATANTVLTRQSNPNSASSHIIHRCSQFSFDNVAANSNPSQPSQLIHNQLYLKNAFYREESMPTGIKIHNNRNPINHNAILSDRMPTIA